MYGIRYLQMFYRFQLIGVDCEETGAQGVAIAAGIGAGVYKDYEDAFEKAVKVKEPVLPDDSTFPYL